MLRLRLRYYLSFHNIFGHFDIGKNNQLQTTLYIKPTYTYNNLHSKSSYLNPLQNNLEVSQALTIRWIGSNNNLFIIESQLNAIFEKKYFNYFQIWKYF